MGKNSKTNRGINIFMCIGCTMHPIPSGGNMKNNIIKFEAQTDYIFNVGEKPIPAVKLIPDWWKTIPKYSTGKFELSPYATVTVKQCAPTIDMFSSGYILTLWADVMVTQTESGPYVKWAVNQPVFNVWDKQQISHFPAPVGFNNVAFKYMHGWNIITPPGYSTLFIHPPAYESLPIKAIPGIVDTDILDSPINCPIFIKEGFEGVIEKGTPIVQLIPFKRENWISEYSNPGDKKNQYALEKLATKLYGYYSSKRKKKIYK